MVISSSTDLRLRHLLLDLDGCDAVLCDDLEAVRHVLAVAIEASGSSLLGIQAHRFSPQGVTAVALLAESHLSIHTWPERGYVAADLLTCRASSDLERVAARLREGFRAQSMELRLIERSDRKHRS